MILREVRKKFLEILGGACECGEKREGLLELTKKSSQDKRKINHLLMERGVEESFGVLKEDFLILCLNCKRWKELSDPEFKRRKARLLKVSREKYYDKYHGKKKVRPLESPEERKEEALQIEFNPSSEFSEEEQNMIVRNPSLEATLRRLKLSKGKA